MHSVHLCEFWKSEGGSSCLAYCSQWQGWITHSLLQLGTLVCSQFFNMGPSVTVVTALAPSSAVLFKQRELAGVSEGHVVI